MDIKAFKTSGILELYVLGMASEEEAREVERLILFPATSKYLTPSRRKTFGKVANL